jgi:hypothetical protein
MAATDFPASPATCNALPAGSTSPAYALVADQLGASGSNARFFGTNADGILWEHTSSFGAIMPETGRPTAGQPLTTSR